MHFQRERILMNFTVPRGSEWSERASPWMERVEGCVARERIERCERTNIASDLVARYKCDCLWLDTPSCPLSRVHVESSCIKFQRSRSSLDSTYAPFPTIETAPKLSIIEFDFVGIRPIYPDNTPTYARHFPIVLKLRPNILWSYPNLCPTFSNHTQTYAQHSQFIPKLTPNILHSYQNLTNLQSPISNLQSYPNLRPIFSSHTQTHAQQSAFSDHIQTYAQNSPIIPTLKPIILKSYPNLRPTFFNHTQIYAQHSPITPKPMPNVPKHTKYYAQNTPVYLNIRPSYQNIRP